MLKIFAAHKPGTDFEVVIGDLLKSHFNIHQGFVVKEGDGLPTAYFVAQGLQTDKCPTTTLSLWVATSTRASEGRLCVTIRCETENPHLLNCPPELVHAVEQASEIGAYDFQAYENARNFRSKVLAHHENTPSTSRAKKCPL